MCGGPHGDAPADFGSAYRLLVHLCKLGARPPVIRDIVPAIIKRPLIYSTWQTIHGHCSPRGLIPSDILTCLSTAVQRLHTTVVLLQIEQQGDMAVYKRAISAYEIYAAMMAHEKLFDFNRVWMISRAASVGKIGLHCCRQCGTRYAYNKEDVRDVSNCPACALKSSRACGRPRVGGASADVSVAREPVTVDKGPADRGFRDAYTLLENLCRLGARPPVIRDLLPEVITRPMILSTWRAINGKPPPQGQLPQSIDSLLCSNMMRFHVTAVLIELHKCQGMSPVERITYAYERYLNSMGSEAVLDFNRVWFIARSVNCARLKLAKCTCGTRFAFSQENVADVHACPACAISKSGRSALGVARPKYSRLALSVAPGRAPSAIGPSEAIR